MEDLEIKGNLISERELWSVINMLPWVHFKSGTSGKVYSYCPVATPLVKTRKSQKLAVLLCSLRKGCPSHHILAKVSRAMKRTFGKSPDCQHPAVADTQQVKEQFGSVELKRFLCRKFIPVTDLPFYTPCSWSYQEMCVISIIPQ